LNYFNYFTEIEDTFVRRRQKHLMLCPLDWALIEMWKERGIPLHIVLRGIERWFDFYEKKRRRRSVNMLVYCQEEVEAQYEEWLDSRVGAGSDNFGKEIGDPTGRDDEGLPFPRQAILEYLRHGRAALLLAWTERKKKGVDDLTDALTRVESLLEDLEREFSESVSPDAQTIEVSLTGLERMLNDSILAVIPGEEREAAMREVKEQLRPYRSHMEKTAYDQTFANLLLKRLREQFAVPRLSLFYL
jgi:hypothetical protein